MTTLVAAKVSARAMSCRSSIVVTADGDERARGLARDGARRVHELEARWSRFLESSEVSRLNAAHGELRVVSHDTAVLIESMVDAWHATGGAFDPTLLAPLVELGYASSRDDASRWTSPAADWNRRGAVAQIRIDAATGAVRLPRGTAVDPGGIGKGVAADLIVDELIDAGACGALVEIGGDLAARGAAPEGSGWTIAIADPHGAASTDRLVLAAGGVATSSSRLRTWTTDGTLQHHLLDPRTLRPTDTDIVACTVVAGSAASAEAFTKLAFVDGTVAAMERYEQIGLAARISSVDGEHHHSSAWGDFYR